MKNTPEKRLDIVEDTSKASSEAVKELDEVDGKTKREIAKKFKEKLKNFKKEATPQKDNNKEKDNNKKLNKLKNNRETEYKELLDALGNDFVPKMKEYFKQAEHRNKIKDNNPSNEEIRKSLDNDKLGMELVWRLSRVGLYSMRLEENRDKYGDSNPNIMKYPSRAIKKGKKLLEELEGYTN